MRKPDAAEKPADWLLTVRCECGDWVVIDASQGPTSAVTLPPKLHLTCDSCGRASSYGFADVRHSRVARPAFPTAPQPDREVRIARAQATVGAAAGSVA